MSPAEEGGMGLQSLCFYIRRRTKSRNATVLPFGITVAFFMAVLRPFFKPDKNISSGNGTGYRPDRNNGIFHEVQSLGDGYQKTEALRHKSHPQWCK